MEESLEIISVAGLPEGKNPARFIAGQQDRLEGKTQSELAISFKCLHPLSWSWWSSFPCISL